MDTLRDIKDNKRERDIKFWKSVNNTRMRKVPFTIIELKYIKYVYFFNIKILLE